MLYLQSYAYEKINPIIINYLHYTKKLCNKINVVHVFIFVSEIIKDIVLCTINIVYIISYLIAYGLRAPRACAFFHPSSSTFSYVTKRFPRAAISNVFCQITIQRTVEWY